MTHLTVVALAESKQKFSARALVDIFCAFPSLLVSLWKREIYVALLELLDRPIRRDLELMGFGIPYCALLLAFIDRQERVCKQHYLHITITSMIACSSANWLLVHQVTMQTAPVGSWVPL